MSEWLNRYIYIHIYYKVSESLNTSNDPSMRILFFIESGATVSFCNPQN